MKKWSDAFVVIACPENEIFYLIDLLILTVNEVELNFPEVCTSSGMQWNIFGLNLISFCTIMSCTRFLFQIAAFVVKLAKRTRCFTRQTRLCLQCTRLAFLISMSGWGLKHNQGITLYIYVTLKHRNHSVNEKYIYAMWSVLIVQIPK